MFSLKLLLKKKKRYGLFLLMDFNCLKDKLTATSRRKLTFLPLGSSASWYSFSRPRKDEG